MVFIKESKGLLGFLTSAVSKPRPLMGDGGNWKFLFCIVARAAGRRDAVLHICCVLRNDGGERTC